VDGRIAVLGERWIPRRSRWRWRAGGCRSIPASSTTPSTSRGVVTTSKDPEGRTTVLDLLGFAERVLPVGRLDAPTEGLLLLTNDGELSHRLAHPSYEVPRTYLAEVKGSPGASPSGVSPRRVSRSPRRHRPGRQRDRRRRPPGPGCRSLVEVVVHEGRKHVVRNMLGAVDLPVVRLVRTQFGPLRLDRLAPGSYRRLSQAEVAALYETVGL